MRAPESATRTGSRHPLAEAAHGAVRTHNCQFEAFYRSGAAGKQARQLDRFGFLQPTGDATLRINWNARDAAMQRN